MVLLVATMLFGAGLQAATPQVAATNDLLDQENAIAREFVSKVHIAGFPFQPRAPQVLIETHPQLSYFDGDNNTIVEGRFSELPPPAQAMFNQWAADTPEEPSGEKFFANAFYRFYFVHELGHWLCAEVIANRNDPGKQAALENMNHNHWQAELEANRISIAWWREHDPTYLAKIMADFSALQRKLPNPVRAGQSMREYFNANYGRLGEDPQAYGWFPVANSHGRL